MRYVLEVISDVLRDLTLIRAVTGAGGPGRPPIIPIMSLHAVVLHAVYDITFVSPTGSQASAFGRFLQNCAEEDSEGYPKSLLLGEVLTMYVLATSFAFVVGLSVLAVCVAAIALIPLKRSSH